MDEYMGELYSKVRTAKPTPATLLGDQRSWLKKRSLFCGAFSPDGRISQSQRQCLIELYDSRIADLEKTTVELGVADDMDINEGEDVGPAPQREIEKPAVEKKPEPKAAESKPENSDNGGSGGNHPEVAKAEKVLYAFYLLHSVGEVCSELGIAFTDADVRAIVTYGNKYKQEATEEQAANAWKKAQTDAEPIKAGRAFARDNEDTMKSTEMMCQMMFLNYGAVKKELGITEAAPF